MQNSIQSVPRKIGGFEVLSKIGQGGMGAVLKARQLSLDRIVALKVLPPQIAQKDPIFIERFFREARVSAKLNHANIVQGIEVGQDEASGLYYFAMEYIDGPTLRQVLKKEGPLEERRALEIVASIAGALDCANRAGIVHRDIKPDNILLTSRGEPKLADLGLAKRVSDIEEATSDAGPTSGPGVDASLTQAGSALGTPYYMAPEQVTGRGQIDVRTDLYALGATLYYLVTGKQPFSGKNSAEIMQARLSAPAPDPRKADPNLREETACIITTLMQRDPAQRFQTPVELEQAIKGAIQNWDAPAEDQSPQRQKVGVVSRNALRSGERRSSSRIDAKPRSSIVLYVGGAIVLIAVAAVAAFSGGKVAEPDHVAEVPAKAALGKVDPAGGQHEDKASKLSSEPAKEPNASASTPIPKPAEPAATETKAPDTTPPSVVIKKEEHVEPPETAPPATGSKAVNEAASIPEAKPASADQPISPVALETKPDRKPAMREPAAAPVPAVMDAAAQKALDDLLTDYAVFMCAGADQKAAELLSNAAKKPEFVASAPLIQAEQRRIVWLPELDKSVQAGAAKLVDNRVFTLVTKAGKKDAIGGTSKMKVTGVKDGVIQGEYSEAGASMFPRWKIADLTDDTRRELSLMGAEGDSKAVAELKAKWAYLAALACVVKPNALNLANAQSELTEARAGGANADTAAAAEWWLTRIHGKVEAANKAEADRVALEKRKADEQRTSQNFYNKTQAGDWAAYRRVDGKRDSVRLTVIKKDDKSVTATGDLSYSVEQNAEQAINLSAPYTISDALNFSKDARKTDEGEETININGKKYKCKREFYWDAWHRNPKNKSEYTEVEHQVWICPDVPLAGIVRYRVKWITSHDPRHLVKEGLFGFLFDLDDFGTGATPAPTR